MSALIWFVAAAFAADPSAPPSASVASGAWAGIPLERAAELGLGEPTVSRVAGEWRAPILCATCEAGTVGGLVRVLVLPDAETAHRAFEHQRDSAANRAPAALAQADEAAGDDAFRVVRDRNVVLIVRDYTHHAGDVVDRLRGALVQTGCEGTWTTEEADGQAFTWDRCGVLRP